MTTRAAPAKVVHLRAHERAPEALQGHILHVVEEGWRTDGRSPSYREMSAALGGRALSLIKHHVDALVGQGLLHRERGSRGLLPARPVGTPMLGPVAAGAPLDVFDSDDVELLEVDPLTRALPGERRTPQRNAFALHVRGDSMVEDRIFDGDFAIIAPTP